MDFFAYSFIRTNEYGEITHWETHVNPAYNDFLDVAIGEHGPYDCKFRLTGVPIPLSAA